MKKRTLLAILLGIYLVYNVTVLAVWAGSVPSDPPFLALVMGPILWVIAIVATGVTTWAAYKFLPKESPRTGPKAAADGGMATVTPTLRRSPPGRQASSRHSPASPSPGTPSG